MILFLHYSKSHGSLSGWICKDIELEHKGLLSQDVYNELIENIEWDLGQDTLRGELAQENQKVMKCLFDGGFNYDNLMLCVGQNYEKVIDAYHHEFDSTRYKFEDSILNALKHNGYDKIASESFDMLKKDLDEALANSCNPERALNDFERAVVGVVPTNMARLESLKKKTHGHYLVYLSFKRLIKAYILLTISCIQNFVEKSELPMPREFNYRLYSQATIDEMFPDDEITKLYTKKVASEDNNKEEDGSSFNESLYKQGKYRHMVAFNIATGQVDPGTIDVSKTPKEIYDEVMASKTLEQKDDRLV